jgi:hypothetical protein
MHSHTKAFIDIYIYIYIHNTGISGGVWRRDGPSASDLKTWEECRGVGMCLIMGTRASLWTKSSRMSLRARANPGFEEGVSTRRSFCNPPSPRITGREFLTLINLYLAQGILKECERHS